MPPPGNDDPIRLLVTNEVFPLCYLVDGKVTGVLAELWKLVSEVTGRPLQFIIKIAEEAAEKNWYELYDSVVDVFIPARHPSIAWSSPFIVDALNLYERAEEEPVGWTTFCPDFTVFEWSTLVLLLLSLVVFRVGIHLIRNRIGVPTDRRRSVLSAVDIIVHLFALAVVVQHYGAYFKGAVIASTSRPRYTNASHVMGPHRHLERFYIISRPSRANENITAVLETDRIALLRRLCAGPYGVTMLYDLEINELAMVEEACRLAKVPVDEFDRRRFKMLEHVGIATAYHLKIAKNRTSSSKALFKTVQRIILGHFSQSQVLEKWVRKVLPSLHNYWMGLQIKENEYIAVSLTKLQTVLQLCGAAAALTIVFFAVEKATAYIPQTWLNWFGHKCRRFERAFNRIILRRRED